MEEEYITKKELRAYQAVIDKRQELGKHNGASKAAQLVSFVAISAASLGMYTTYMSTTYSSDPEILSIPTILNGAFTAFSMGLAVIAGNSFFKGERQKGGLEKEIEHLEAQPAYRSLEL